MKLITEGLGTSIHRQNCPQSSQPKLPANYKPVCYFCKQQGQWNRVNSRAYVEERLIEAKDGTIYGVCYNHAQEHGIGCIKLSGEEDIFPI